MIDILLVLTRAMSMARVFSPLGITEIAGTGCRSGGGPAVNPPLG